MAYPRIAKFRDSAAFRKRLDELGLSMPLDDQWLSAADGSPLAMPIELAGRRVGNRFCIHPMEGWDAEPDGAPSPLTMRRWTRFGESGAKWIWGGEAGAVRHDGRANPRQLLVTPEHRSGLASLLDALRGRHRECYGVGGDDDLMVGLQLTHSGRYCRPNDSKRAEPRIAYHHPLLDAKCGIDPSDSRVVWTDGELEGLIESYVAAANVASEVGFDFVDVKACHGYLLHELLSARTRGGKYGGDMEGRCRLLRSIVAAVRSVCPTLAVGVRLSLFDSVPYQSGAGVPMPFDDWLPYVHGFGCDGDDPLQIDLSEPMALLQSLMDDGVFAVNLTAGSPYYNPHLQRPALFPPSDGYQPPEDPLCGVARQMDAVARCKAAFPTLPIVGSAYTYLQEFLPLVGQAAVRDGWVDCIGLGRMVLSYPTLPRDVLEGRFPQRKLVCRTFSDCTTYPRRGEVSGCYPLDPFYKAMRQTPS
jgi:NADPH2 dehydrogenase